MRFGGKSIVGVPARTRWVRWPPHPAAGGAYARLAGAGPGAPRIWLAADSVRTFEALYGSLRAPKGCGSLAREAVEINPLVQSGYLQRQNWRVLHSYRIVTALIGEGRELVEGLSRWEIGVSPGARGVDL